jgi:sulfide:quinone oxidoreductase
MAKPSSRNTSAARVVIVGGGVAALEAALALRALAGELADLTLISASATFAYRPAVTTTAFDDGTPPVFDLRQIADDLQAQFEASAVEAVLPRQRTVQLESGREVAYDALVLATGAHAVGAVPGALTFRDQRDVPRFKRILDALAAGAVERLVFAVPSQQWPLPAYELAMLCSLYAVEKSVPAQIAIVSPEAEPLSAFGAQASRRVAELLAEREIGFLGHSVPHSVSRDGALATEFDGSVPADRVVALPELRAARVRGVPASWSGFVPTDAEGRVDGLADVYAAGDVTTFPVKQGGLAAQQADRVAETIAAELGADVKETHETRVLRARLLTGDGSLVLRTELDTLGRPTPATLQHRESRGAEIPKVFGRYLTPYLSIHASRPGGAAAAV